jgi:LysM repeat protein
MQRKKLLISVVGILALWQQPAVAAEDCSYHVVKVNAKDSLLIRFGPHVKYKKLGSIPHDGIKVKVTGPELTVGKSHWVPIEYQGISGWVNQGYLKSDCPVTTATAATATTDSETLPDYHTVAEGETLFSLSQRYGATVEEMAQWNELKPPYNLSAGQSLRVSPPTCFYRVIKVKANDMLWVRSEPDVKSKRVGGIPHDETEVEVTGAEKEIDKSRWVPVSYKGITGWVNRNYLEKNCQQPER